MKKGRTSLRGTCPFSSLCPLLDVFMQRLSVRCIPGDYIVLSSTPGVGRAVGSCEAYPANKIVGYACEGDDRTDMRLIKVRVGGV